MRECNDKVVALVDLEKIGFIGGISLFTLDELDIVITGQKANPDIMALLQSKNVTVYHV